ncbi:MAG: hypothetical protein KDA61_15725, partial [Planctomycetales bacterium]|nr:hypothetical protein [Planctomycetales bacterium]
AFFSVSTNSYPFIKLLNVAAFAAAGGLGLLFLLQTLHRLSVGEAPTADLESKTLDATEAGATGVDALAQVAATSTLPGARANGRTASPLEMPKGQLLGGHTRTVFRIWIFLFALVGAQLGWVLRPFIGSPDSPFEWFRTRQSNFFADVLQALGALITGS